MVKLNRSYIFKILITILCIGVSWLAIIGAISLLGPKQPTPFTPVTDLPAQTIQSPDIYQLWRLTNDKRGEAGLKPLDLSAYLNASAMDKCNDMASRNYWSHNAPDGVEPWVFIRKHYPSYSFAGENLAYGLDTSSDVVDSWMKSEGHKKNILDLNYTKIGFSVCESADYLDKGPQIIVVQHFAG